jgi:hypothetical protein
MGARGFAQIVGARPKSGKYVRGLQLHHDSTLTVGVQA